MVPADGNAVVTILDGQLTAKRPRLGRGRVRLAAENPDYPDIVIPVIAELGIWGVVTRCLHYD